MTFLQEIQKDLEKKNLKPENFKDPIIFMSMFNDIKWKKNDENCISNAEKVKNYAKSFLPGHWTFLGPGLEKRWYGDSHGGQWDRTANKTVQQFDRNWSSHLRKYQCFESRFLGSREKVKAPFTSVEIL